MGIRSLTFVRPAGAPAFAPAADPAMPPPPPNGFEEYAKTFAKIIPAESIAAYVTFTGIAAKMSDPKGSATIVAWICLVSAFAIRLLTGTDPQTNKLQWLPGLGAALAFALYVYSQGNTLGTDFGIPKDDLVLWASILVGVWAAFAPILIPRLVALIKR